MTKMEMLQLLDDTKVKGCTKCEALACSRSNTVFGEGNANASVVFCGEAPGLNEDLSGRPFVGRAGKLLDEFIEYCGWKREDVFILNTIKCRPPNNRNPEPLEAENCRPYLDLQLKVINPRYIVCLGKVASYYLLKKEGPIERLAMRSLRGRFHEVDGRKVLCSWHPAYVLRTPTARTDVLNDLQILLRDLQRPLPG